MKLMIEQEEDAALMAAASDLPNFSKAGTGKTFTALRAAQLTGLPRGLVLAPKIALSMWTENIELFFGGKPTLMGSSAVPCRGDWIVTTYDIAANNKAKLYDWAKGQNAVLINDESHNVRSPTAKRTKAVFGANLDMKGGIAERFAQVWNLTGTPMVRYADDYYTQAALMHPEVFSQIGVNSLADFERMFTYKQKKQYNPRMQPVWKISGNTNELKLKALIYDKLGAIRRLEPPSGLPPLRERRLNVAITLDREVRAALKGMTHDDILKLFNSKDSIVARMWRLIGLAKVDEVVPYVGECAKDSPILLGIWHRDVASAYDTAFKDMGLNVAQVNGDTPMKQREDIRVAFNNGSIDVLIGQMGAMGVSWNLQRASNHVIIAEVTPSAAVVEQFYKRVYRFGQANSVQVDHILCDHEIDQALFGVQQRKAVSDEKING